MGPRHPGLQRPRVRRALCAAAIATLWLPLSTADAAPKPKSARRAAAAASPKEQGFSLEGGIGFTAGPGSFLMGLAAPYAIDQSLSLGPRLELGFADGVVIVAPSLNARYGFDMSGFDDDLLRRLRPYLQAGAGIAYIQHKHGKGEDDGVGGLIDLGFGIEYPLSQKVSIGSGMLFHVVPGSPAGETFYFSWQMVSARLRF
jgi:hypothetical protein